jgi:hypothetical protein
VAPIDPRIETAEEVRDRVLEAAGPFRRQLGTTRLRVRTVQRRSPTPRETAFAKIRARVEGTRLASAARRGMTMATFDEEDRSCARLRCRTRRHRWRANGPN